MNKMFKFLLCTSALLLLFVSSPTEALGDGPRIVMKGNNHCEITYSNFLGCTYYDCKKIVSTDYQGKNKDGWEIATTVYVDSQGEKVTHERRVKRVVNEESSQQNDKKNRASGTTTVTETFSQPGRYNVYAKTGGSNFTFHVYDKQYGNGSWKYVAGRYY